ncbi:hypothetical protein [Streptomyces rapamycinicus]|uniref:hypothetical protein n=1 Tax=Streptomyces rapamycinicus TaxID=1226757 RepID=UPI0032D94036
MIRRPMVSVPRISRRVEKRTFPTRSGSTGRGSAPNAFVVMGLKTMSTGTLTITPARPHRVWRAAAKTMTLPTMVKEIERNNPICGGESSTASKPYSECHHRSRSPKRRNRAAPVPVIR